MSKLTSKVTLVVGAESDIGLATATVLARVGTAVVAESRPDQPRV